MKFANKCALDKEQILYAAKEGFKYLEFHTALNHFQYSLEEIKEFRNLLDSLGITCVAVHLPIEYTDIKYDYICIPAKTEEDRQMFMDISKKAIDFLDILSSAENPIIVSHVGYAVNYSEDELCNNTKETLNNKLEKASNDLRSINDYILNKNNSIIFTVENMPNIVVKGDKMVYWSFGGDKDLPDYIKDLSLSNIKCCLDTCHAEMRLRIINMLDCKKTITIEDYIEWYKDVLGHIHLNNTKCLGYNNPHHSTPFEDNEEDIKYLSTIIKSLKRNNIDCSITLEIVESDLLERQNIKITKRTLEKVLKNLDLPSI